MSDDKRLDEIARAWVLSNKDEAVQVHLECIENEEPCTLVDSLVELLKEAEERGRIALAAAKASE